MALNLVLDPGTPGVTPGAAKKTLGDNVLGFVVTGSGTVKIEATLDGTNWVTGAYAAGNGTTAVGGTTLVPNDIGIPYLGGVHSFRANGLTGSPVVTMIFAQAST